VVIAFTMAFAISPLTHAQSPTTTPVSPVPQTSDTTEPLRALLEARQALDHITAATGETGRLVDNLRRDFQALQQAYVAQNAGPRPNGAGSSLSGSTTEASTGSVPAPIGTAASATGRAVGTSGVIGPGTNDWRALYAVVTSDIAGVASADAASVVRPQLDELRTRLEKFFEATLGPATASAPRQGDSVQASSPTRQSEAAPDTSPPNAEALALLQRMEELVNRRQSDEKKLKGAGKVTLDRADTDEVLAEIQELKAMLRR
jgi:hypothetical protein